MAIFYPKLCKSSEYVLVLLCFTTVYHLYSVHVFVWQIQALVQDSPLLTKLANSQLYPLIYVVQQFIHWLFMGYPLVPFCLFTYDKWLKVNTNLLKPHQSKDLFFFLCVTFIIQPALGTVKGNSNLKSEVLCK